MNKQTRLLGITKKIRLFFSECVETAETRGFLKPMILMPVSLITHLSPVQLEAIIVHELLHIRRNDFLIHLLMTCYRHVFFFNPFAHIFYQTVCHQRELACDDGVVARNISPRIYAEALYHLEKYRQLPASFALAADGHRPWLLHERIARLLGTPARIRSGFRVLPYFAVLIALFLLNLSSQPIRIMPKTQAAEKTVAVIPVSFRSSDQHFPLTKIQIQLKQKPSAVTGKPVVLKVPVPEIQILKVDIYKTAPDILQFAGHREVRNFSNEKNSTVVELPEKSVTATPFVPAQSFEYIPGIEVNLTDSLIQIRMKQVIAYTIIQKTALKNQLKSAEHKISSELKNIESRRKVYQGFNEKNFNHLLNNLQEQIEQKKVEIDRINIQSQSLDEEIIHI